MQTSYQYSVENDTLNGAVDEDGLTWQIRASSITISLDYIEQSTDTETGVKSLVVWFKDEMSIGDKVTLDGLVAAHDGTNPNGVPASGKFDSDGYSIVRTQSSIEGSGPWFKSPNMVGAAKTGWADPDNNIVLKVIPNAGKKLLVSETKMSFDSAVSLDDKPAWFRGVYNGNVLWERQYANVWDYRENCDDMREFTWGGIAHWRYSPPIVLKSSALAEIHLVMPDGPFLVGVRAMIKIKALALPETT